MRSTVISPFSLYTAREDGAQDSRRFHSTSLIFVEAGDCCNEARRGAEPGAFARGFA